MSLSKQKLEQPGRVLRIAKPLPENPRIKRMRDNLIQRDYSKYFWNDFEKDYVKEDSIKSDQALQFLTDLRSVFYIINRGSGHYYYVNKLSETEPACIQKSFKLKFPIEIHGEKSMKDITYIRNMGLNYGIKFVYGSIVYKPSAAGEPVQNEADELNMFSQFKCVPFEEEKLDQARLDKIQPILKLIKDVICGGDEEWYKWMISWIHHLLYRPQIKIGKYILLLGGPGCGKSTFIKWMVEWIIGQRQAAELPDLSTYFTRFNSLSQNMSLACFGQMPPMDKHKKISGLINTNVTEVNQALEKKGIDTIKVISYANFIFASCYFLRAMYLERGDMRAAVPPVDEKYADNDIFFDQIYACFNEDCANIFATYVKYYKDVIDITKKSNLPYSEKKKAIQTHQQSNHLTFLDGVHNATIDLREYIQNIRKRYELDNKKDKMEIIFHSTMMNRYVRKKEFYSIYKEYVKEYHGGKYTNIVSKIDFFATVHSALTVHSPLILKKESNRKPTARLQCLIKIPYGCLNPPQDKINEQEVYEEPKIEQGYFKKVLDMMLQEAVHMKKEDLLHKYSVELYSNVKKIICEDKIINNMSSN